MRTFAYLIGYIPIKLTLYCTLTGIKTHFKVVFCALYGTLCHKIRVKLDEFCNRIRVTPETLTDNCTKLDR